MLLVMSGRSVSMGLLACVHSSAAVTDAVTVARNVASVNARVEIMPCIETALSYWMRGLPAVYRHRVAAVAFAHNVNFGVSGSAQETIPSKTVGTHAPEGFE